MKFAQSMAPAVAALAFGSLMTNLHAATPLERYASDSFQVAINTSGHAQMPAPNMTDAEDTKKKAQRDAKHPNKKTTVTVKQRGDEVLPTGEGFQPKSPETRDAELQKRQAQRAEKRGGKPPLIKVSPTPEAPLYNH